MLKNNLETETGLMEKEKRKDMIFDQLNPAYAKYYKKQEIEKELMSVEKEIKNL